MVTDAIEAVQQGWIEATIIHHDSNRPVGTSLKRYTHQSVQFVVRPQARLNWKMFHSVTLGIMQVLLLTLHNGTTFTILGDAFEGNLGWGTIRNI